MTPPRVPKEYRVEVVDPGQSDPAAEEAVRQWIWDHVVPDGWKPPSPPPKPVSVKARLRAHKAEFPYCQGCQYRPPAEHRSRALHVHHVRPQASGGDHHWSNLLVLCARCHALAHALMKRRPVWTQWALQRRLLFLELKRRKGLKP